MIFIRPSVSFEKQSERSGGAGYNAH